MAQRQIVQRTRPDAIRLLSWLADADHKRMLAESWFWKRFHAVARDERGIKQIREAVVNMVSARVGVAPLRWPGDVGKPPSGDTQTVWLSAAWLRGLVEIPELDAPVETWTEAAIVELGAELAGRDGLPWNIIADEQGFHSGIRRSRARTYGGRFEVILPHPAISTLADSAALLPVAILERNAT